MDMKSFGMGTFIISIAALVALITYGIWTDEYTVKTSVKCAQHSAINGKCVKENITYSCGVVNTYQVIAECGSDFEKCNKICAAKIKGDK